MGNIPCVLSVRRLSSVTGFFDNPIKIKGMLYVFIYNETSKSLVDAPL